jgi:2,3-bisphosphoglycerate-independent phosphoglycerate mutase
MNSKPKPVILCILDGWGYREDRTDNAVALAATPNWDELLRSSPQALLKTCGLDVGLPEGQMGNSEVGHMNLGAGRVVMQDLPRIDQAVKDGSLQSNPELQKLIKSLQENKGTCHLMGLLSPGGVHSHQDHIAALARYVSEAGVPVVLHIWTYGRDTPPQSAKDYLKKFIADTKDLKNFSIGTLGGRYYAMDRDKRWDRIALAYNAIVAGEAPRETDANTAINSAYRRGQGPA